MTSVTVNSTAALNAALTTAQAGETILLAGGTYTGVSATGINPAGTVTITSLDPNNQAVLSNFTVSGSSNLLFSNLELNTVGSSDPYYAYRVYSSNNIQFDHVYVHGAIGTDPNAAITGFLVQGNTNFSITNSTFDTLQTGISQLNNTGLLFSGNSFANMAADGIDGGGSSYVQVLNNTFTSTATDTIGLHPDAIQFWTYGTTTSAHDITISGNVYTRGTGAPAQGIFMGNEANIPYVNVTITNNTIDGAQYNAIAVGDVQNLTISGNVVQAYADMDSWIRVESSTGAQLSNNQASNYVFNGDTNLTQTNDTTIAAIPVPVATSGTTLTTTSTQLTTTTQTVTGASQPTTTNVGPTPVNWSVAPTGLALDASTNSGAAGGNITNNGKVEIDGAAQPGSTVNLYDGATKVGSGTADATTGAFKITVGSALADGSHTLTAVASDGTGDVTPASSPLTVIVDTHAATAVFTSASAGASGAIVLSGTSSDAANAPYTVSVLQDGAKAMTVTPVNGAWSVTESNLGSVVHQFTVTTTDAAGNIGTGANTVIVGTSGRDTIVGGNGDNIIVGGGGADTLTGGSHSNTFVYNSLSDAPTPNNRNQPYETITNWVSGSDHLNLTAVGHMVYKGQTAAVPTHTVEWYQSGGNTFVVGNSTGHAGADFTIELLGLHTLTASDFVLS